MSMGIGDWGLGIEDRVLKTIKNPQNTNNKKQSPITNPQSPIPNPQYLFNFELFNSLKENKTNLNNKN